MKKTIFTIVTLILFSINSKAQQSNFKDCINGKGDYQSMSDLMEKLQYYLRETANPIDDLWKELDNEFKNNNNAEYEEIRNKIREFATIIFKSYSVDELNSSTLRYRVCVSLEEFDKFNDAKIESFKKKAIAEFHK